MIYRLLLSLTLLLSVQLANAQDTAADTRTNTVSIQSALTKQTLQLTVILPSGYDATNKQRYPVIFSNSDSRRMALMQKQLDWLSHIDFGPIPKLIIVGLPNIGDLNSPQHKDAAASGKDTALAIKVLQQEILPYVDKHFKTQPFRIIEGYSTDANLALGVLASAPQLFNAYVSVNPALVLDKTDLVTRLQTFLASSKVSNKQLSLYVYVTLGDFVQNKPLFNTLRKSANKKNTHFVDLSASNYYTAAVTALPLALEGLFADRQPKDIKQFLAGGSQSVAKYFAALQRKYGYSVSSASTMLDLSQMQIQKNQFSAAVSSMQQAVLSKPDSLYYLSRLANSQQQNKKISAAKDTLNTALNIAKKNDNDHGQRWIQSLLKELVQ